MTGILLSYLAALLISIAGLCGGVLIFKKYFRIRVRWLSFLIGVLISVGYILGVLMLFRVTFSSGQYYNTTAFRTLVGLVFLVILAVFRMLLLRGILFNRYKEEQGLSFSFGFGAAPLGFMAAYSLIMLLVVGGNALFNGPYILEAEGYLSFADNTIITIFQPAVGHISFAILFAAICLSMINFGHWMKRICTQLFYPAVPAVWVILLALLEAGSLLPIPFMAMYGLSHWQLALIAGLNAIAGAALVLLMPEKKTEESTYTKQFE